MTKKRYLKVFASRQHYDPRYDKRFSCFVDNGGKGGGLERGRGWGWGVGEQHSLYYEREEKAFKEIPFSRDTDKMHFLKTYFPAR